MDRAAGRGCRPRASGRPRRPTPRPRYAPGLAGFRPWATRSPRRLSSPRRGGEGQVCVFWLWLAGGWGEELFSIP